MTDSADLFNSVGAELKDTVIFTLDRDGYISSWNPTVELMFGYSAKEFVGQPGSLTFTPEDIGANQYEHDLAAATTEGRYRVNRWQQRKDGMQVLAATSLLRRHSDNDELNGFIRIIRDLSAEGDLKIAQEKTREATEAKYQAEASLRISETRKDALVLTALDAILIMDGDGIVQEFNPAAERMFGYSRLQAMGRPLAELIIPATLRDAHYQGLKRYIETGQARVLGRRIEIEAMRADGSLFPVELAIVRIPFESRPLFAGYIRDITQRKQAEEDLKRSNEDLTDFAHLVAHELQTPLRTVKGFTQLMLRRSGEMVDADVTEYSSHIIQGISGMEELIAGLLSFAQLGKEQIPAEPVDLNEVLQGSLLALQAAIAESEATVKSEPLPQVRGHALLLQQLFQNLVGNAIKYRQAEYSPDITVVAQKKEREWLLTVTDNGMGISESHLKQIFAPFSRLHGSDIPGTGLGLSACRKIVEVHGGRIWAQSTHGKGSTFLFTLPEDACI